MTTKTITLTNGQTIHTSVKKGRVSKHTPLLIMNGIGASLSLLSPFVEALHKSNPNIEIITFDCPGVGGSSTPCLPYRFSGLSKIVVEMLDVLGYDGVDVLGLSFGGFLAQEFANSFPHRCSKLILAATCAGVVAIPPSIKVLSLMSSPRRYTDPEYAAKVSPEIYGGKFRYDEELVRRHVEKVANNSSETAQSKRGYLYQQLAVTGWSSLLWLHNIKQPTLLLGAGDDPLIDVRNMQLMNKLLPNSTLHVLPDEGHLFLLTSTDEILPIIKRFLS